MTDSRHYRAFISYSHSDEQWARWLQRALEKYKLPKTYRQRHPELTDRLYSIFRDRDELASGLRRHGHPNVFTIDDEETLVETIASVAKSGDLVVGLGAGTITDWINALPKTLEQHRGRA